MNTTKGDGDGWIDAYKIKPPRGKSVLIHSCMGNSCVGWWENGYWQGPVGSIPVAMVRHWRELPEPPKTKDAFEVFWDTLTPDECRGNEFRYAFKNHGMLFKPTAKLVWEAAINSTKQC